MAFSEGQRGIRVGHVAARTFGDVFANQKHLLWFGSCGSWTEFCASAATLVATTAVTPPRWRRKPSIHGFASSAASAILNLEFSAKLHSIVRDYPRYDCGRSQFAAASRSNRDTPRQPIRLITRPLPLDGAADGDRSSEQIEPLDRGRERKGISLVVGRGNVAGLAATVA
jgi:hypothetical protein